MSSILNGLDWIVTEGNDLLWSYILIVMLVGIGLYFTVRTKFVQVRLFGEMLRVLTDKKDGANGVSAFQAFTISAASRVGTGNITGVALAIAIGGPGAVFWMWLIALIGMATALIESTLAQVYKVKDGDQFRGGPAYYMQMALGNRPLGIVFAILTVLVFGFIFNAVQANTIAASFSNVFNVPTWTIGLVLVALTAAIIFGGVKRIAHVTQTLVPVMAILYILVALYVVATNITEIPGVFTLIVESAFGIREVAGATIGAAVMQGIRRGLFSNEAGMGSVPNAAATANVSHPVKQGLVQSLGVFFDTIIVCSATAFIIILAGVYQTGEHEGIVLTQASLGVHVGSWAPYFLAIAILFFAFSSVIGNYYYGETNIEFIKASKVWLTVYRFGVLAMVMFGSMAQVALVWNMADLFMGLMAVLNLVVIVVLGRVAFKVLDDYVDQRRAGKDPQFYAKNIPGLKNAPTWGEDR
jgi:AGCS family alanine or glycine:cation symporter